MSHIVVGTAGHIDHGKTALVRALTGQDTDTLKEERERQITIDLGFAFLGDGITVIDVPGHERFIKNMVTGVATVDYVLLVVAADDGVMPQTREHFDILRLLGVKHGMIVLTKADTVDEDWLELVAEELRGFVGGSFLENAPLHVVDSLSGRGIDALKDDLLKRLDALEKPDTRGVFREYVDRAFQIRGHGTVVTGTVLSGSLRLGEDLEILPGGQRCRARGLQIHGHSVEEVHMGDRAAVNLQGIDLEQVSRGDCICTPGVLHPSYMLDAMLRLLPNSPVIRQRERVRVHIGTSELLGRISLLDHEELTPGSEGFVQIRLESQVAALVGDRYVIRRYSPQQTIGGGEIVDPAPHRHRRSRAEGAVKRLSRIADEELEQRLAGLIADLRKPLWSVEDLVSHTGLKADELQPGLEALLVQERILLLPAGNRRFYLDREILAGIRSELLARLVAWHREQPEQEGMPAAQLRSEQFTQGRYSNAAQILFDFLLEDLTRGDKIERRGALLAIRGHSAHFSPALEAQLLRLHNIIDEAGYHPPRPAELAGALPCTAAELKRLLALARQRGDVMQITPEIWVSRQTWEQTPGRLADIVAEDPRGFTVSEAGKALDGTPRRFSVPFLEALDEAGVTRRVDSLRVLSGQGKG